MTIQIQMIGTGDMFAKNHFNNNALVYTPSGKKLLIDCGTTAPTALHQIDCPIESLDGILITHIHGDHVGGLEEVAFYTKYMKPKKIALYTTSTLLERLWEHTLKGSMQDRDDVTLSDYFEVCPISEGQVHDAAGLAVEIIPSEHIPGRESYSLVLDQGRVFYSADTCFNQGLIEELAYKRGCSALLHECQLSGHPAVHTGLEELLTLPEDIQARMYLMHVADNAEAYSGRIGRMRFMKQGEIYTF